MYSEALTDKIIFANKGTWINSDMATDGQVTRHIDGPMWFLYTRIHRFNIRVAFP